MIQFPSLSRNLVSWWSSQWRRRWDWFRRSGLALVMAITLVMTGLTGCGDQPVEEDAPKVLKPQRRKTRIEEVAPPALIQQLNRKLERYQPQVKFIEPRRGATFQSDSVTVKLSVQDLPLFKDEELGLGPHLTLVLDDECQGPIFDVSEPIQLDNLTPGTHTLRVFADRPWHESFKNEGAFAQVTFNIFEGSRRNNPSLKKPLLTYSQPAGTVATEPVLLDFYLTNAPLHWVAREDATDNIEDWRVQATINGESFILDSWQPVYLQGLQSGKNWVELELLGDDGEPLDNVYNDTVEVITLDSTAVTSLTRLFRGEVPYEEALAIVDPDYVRPEPEPVIEPESVVVPEAVEPEPVVEPKPDVTPEPTAGIEEAPKPAIAPEPEVTSEPTIAEDAADLDEEQGEEDSIPESVTEAESRVEEVFEPAKESVEVAAEEEPDFQTLEPAIEEVVEDDGDRDFQTLESETAMDEESVEEAPTAIAPDIQPELTQGTEPPGEELPAEEEPALGNEAFVQVIQLDDVLEHGVKRMGQQVSSLLN